MPIYQYEPKDPKRSCDHCRDGFEVLQQLSDDPLSTCPECDAPVHRVISAPAIGEFKTGLDHRAKDAGFHKLKKLGKGEYEKEY